MMKALISKNRKKLNFLKYILFLAIGAFIFWWVYRDLEVEVLYENLKSIHYEWIILSFLVGLLSHVSRAYRWNMLIKPLGHSPKISNSFMSVMVMYLTNLALPRAGEIARCSVLSRYEKVPFSKLLGTVVVERITDFLVMIFFAILIFLAQINVFIDFVKGHPEFEEKIAALMQSKNLFIAGAVFIAGIAFLFLFRGKFKKTKFYKKIRKILNSFVDGIKTIGQMERPWLYVFHTLFIYFIWLVSLYLMFFSFEPTRHLSIFAAAAAFVTSGLAMVAPVQGGIGPWHFMVYETLFFYGITKADGKIFALVAHSGMNLGLILAGFIALVLLPLVNEKKGVPNI